MKRISYKSLGTLIAILVSLLIILMVGSSLIRLNRQSREAGLRVAGEALERAVMQCYALEGAYPPSLDYLVENYGLLVNQGKYVYLYEPVAGNIHPIIGVQFPGSVGE